MKLKGFWLSAGPFHDGEPHPFTMSRFQEERRNCYAVTPWRVKRPRKFAGAEKQNSTFPSTSFYDVL
jgi:hypothetical protein